MGAYIAFGSEMDVVLGDNGQRAFDAVRRAERPRSHAACFAPRPAAGLHWPWAYRL